MSNDTAPDDDFQNELLGLFAMEAYEWLGQILTSLVRLEEVGHPSAAPEAIDAIVRGLTSLGGSAATVDLPGIQESVFSLLPITDRLRAPDLPKAAETLASMRQALRDITAAVAENTKTQATVSFEPPSVDLRRAKDLLTTLHELRRVRARAGLRSRQILHAVIQRVQADLDRGVSRVDTEGIQQFCAETARADADYVQRVTSALPAIGASVTAAKAAMLQPSRVSDEQWKALLATLDQLVELSRQRHAQSFMQFFHGASTFVRLVAERKIAMSPHRFELVEARVRTIGPDVEDWSAAGQVERDAVATLIAA